MKRAQIPPAERTWRSELARAVSQQSFLRGTLLVRERNCGKPTCRCTRGELHVSLYLVRRREGRTEQLFIPRDREEEVRRWVGNEHRLQELLERISESAWDRLRRREP